MPANVQRLLAAALTAFLGTCCARAQDVPPPVEERLQQLEQDVRALRKENTRLRDELGLEGRPGIVVVKPAGREPALALGGLLQFQGEAGDQSDTRFATDNDRMYLRRARLNAGGRFLEDFDFRAELDLSANLAEATTLRAQMTDGYIRWNRFAVLAVRCGQFKTPYGYEQLAPDPRLFTIERSLANDRLTLSRQLGVQVEGEAFTKRLSYAAGLFNGNGVNASANDSEAFLGVARIAGTPWEGRAGSAGVRWTAGTGAFHSHDAALTGQPAEFGFSSRPTGSRDNVFSGERWGWGADSQLHAGRWDLWLEYLRSRFEPTIPLPGDRVNAQGGYVQVSGFVVEKRLQLVAKFDGFDPSTSSTGDVTRNWLAGLNYYLKGDDIKLQFNYLRTDEAAAGNDEGRLLGRMQVIF